MEDNYDPGNFGPYIISARYRAYMRIVGVSIFGDEACLLTNHKPSLIFATTDVGNDNASVRIIERIEKDVYGALPDICIRGGYEKGGYAPWFRDSFGALPNMQYVALPYDIGNIKVRILETFIEVIHGG